MFTFYIFFDEKWSNENFYDEVKLKCYKGTKRKMKYFQRLSYSKMLCHIYFNSYWNKFKLQKVKKHISKKIYSKDEQIAKRVESYITRKKKLFLSLSNLSYGTSKNLHTKAKACHNIVIGKKDKKCLSHSKCKRIRMPIPYFWPKI